MRNSAAQTPRRQVIGSSANVRVTLQPSSITRAAVKRNTDWTTTRTPKNRNCWISARTELPGRLATQWSSRIPAATITRVAGSCVTISAAARPIALEPAPESPTRRPPNRAANSSVPVPIANDPSRRSRNGPTIW